MTAQREAISALLPIKNGIEHLESIRTQLNSTLSLQDEIVVVDDGSTDGTSEKLRRWASEDDRVNLLFNKNSGLSNALNLGLAEASNTWVARFDADDTYLPHRIDRQIEVIDQATVAVFSDYTFHDLNGNYLGYMPSGVFPEAVAVSLSSSRRTPHPSVMFHREAVLDAGGYLQEHFPAEDLSLWLRLQNQGSLRSIPEALLKYTINPNGVSSTRHKLQIQMKKDLLTAFPIAPTYRKSVEENFQTLCYQYQKFEYSLLRSLLLSLEMNGISQSLFKSHASNLITSIKINHTVEDIQESLNFASETVSRRKSR